MRPDIVPGAVFPDYALSDHNEVVRSLSELQGDDLGPRHTWPARRVGRGRLVLVPRLEHAAATRGPAALNRRV